METLLKISTVLSSLVSISTAIIFFIKPIRDRVLGTKKINAGRKCLLRSEMLDIYYKYMEKGTIRQFEYENFLYLYEAYKELGGNSFIDDIYKTIRTWKIST